MKGIILTVNIILICFLGFEVLSEKSKRIKVTRELIQELKKNLELQDYRKNAMLLLIEQNEIIDKFQSSRNEKKKNKKVLELSQKLN